MFTFEVSSDCNQSKIDPPPIHKINIIQEGFLTCTYWYVKQEDSSRSFDKLKDSELVEKMHENGKLLNNGETHSFKIGKTKLYRLERINNTEFIIKSLK